MMRLFAKNGWAVFFLALLFSFLIYGESLQNSFVLDDYSVVINEPNYLSFKTIVKTWTNWQPNDLAAFNISRPASTTVRKILSVFFHGNPIAYHAFNIVLFAVNATLVFLVVQRLIGVAPVSFLAMLFCLFHPLNHIPANWISGHEILLYSIWALLSVLFYLRFINASRKGDLTLSLFFLFLGLFTQEVTIILLVLLPVFDRWMTKGKFNEIVHRAKWHMFLCVCYLIFRLIVSSPTIHSVSLAGPQHMMDFITQINVVAHLFWWYIGKIIFPVDIVFMWSVSLTPSWLGLFTLCLIGFIFLCILKLPINRHIKFGLIWFSTGFLLLVPLSYVYVSAMGQIIEPHWFFLTLNGLFLALAVWFVELHKKMKALVWGSLMVIILVGWGFVSQQNVYVWKDQGTYGRFWISEVPQNPYAYRSIGEDLAHRGKYVDAIDYFKRGLLFMDHALFYRLLAQSYLELGDLKQAHENILQSLQRRPEEAFAHMILGLILDAEGKKDQAIVAMKKATELDPNELSSKLNLADFYIQERKYPQARQLLEDVLKINPNHRERKTILLKLVTLNYFEQRTDTAMTYIAQFLEAEAPPKGLVSISFFLNEMHASGPAGGILLNCINTYPDYPEAYLLLGVVRGNEERWELAEKIWKEGQKHFPHDARFADYLKQLDTLKGQSHAQ